MNLLTFLKTVNYCSILLTIFALWYRLTSEIKNIYKIEIYDINGKKVMQQSTFETAKIDISNLNKGVLFVKVVFKDANMRTIKIIKE